VGRTLIYGTSHDTSSHYAATQTRDWVVTRSEGYYNWHEDEEPPPKEEVWLQNSMFGYAVELRMQT